MYELVDAMLVFTFSLIESRRPVRKTLSMRVDAKGSSQPSLCCDPLLQSSCCGDPQP